MEPKRVITVVIAPNMRYFDLWNKIDNPGERINPRDRSTVLIVHRNDFKKVSGLRNDDQTELRVILLRFNYVGWDRGEVFRALRIAGVTEVLGERLRPSRLF